MVLPDFQFESSLLPANCRYLLGVDEVGRGPWAGPLVVTGLLVDLSEFSPELFIEHRVFDSKQVTSSSRSETAKFLADNCEYFTFSVDAASIDSQGLASSIQYAFQQVVRHFDGKSDFVLIDGNNNYRLPCTKAVIKADQKCFSVAGASIIAKVYRDDLMTKYSLEYPQYGFDRHKGYGTSQHQAALKQHGPCRLHRHSFRPIQQIISGSIAIDPSDH